MGGSDKGSLKGFLASHIFWFEFSLIESAQTKIIVGQHARKRAIAFLMACTSRPFSNSLSNPHSTVNKNHFFKSKYF